MNKLQLECKKCTETLGREAIFICRDKISECEGIKISSHICYDCNLPQYIHIYSEKNVFPFCQLEDCGICCSIVQVASLAQDENIRNSSQPGDATRANANTRIQQLSQQSNISTCDNDLENKSDLNTCHDEISKAQLTQLQNRNQEQEMGQSKDKARFTDKQLLMNISDIVDKSFDKGRSGWKQTSTLCERLIAAILNNVIYNMESPPDFMQFQSKFASPSSKDHVWLCWMNGQPIGFCVIQMPQTLSNQTSQILDFPLLDAIFIRKRFRGKNHTADLLDILIKQYKDDIGLSSPLSNPMLVTTARYLFKNDKIRERLWLVSVGSGKENTNIWFSLTSLFKQRNISLKKISTSSD